MLMVWEHFENLTELVGVFGSYEEFEAWHLEWHPKNPSAKLLVVPASMFVADGTRTVP